MAITGPQVITNQDINNPQNQQQQNPNQPQQGTGPQNPQAQQQANNQIAQNYNPNQQRGSGFTNIQRIVQANQANRLGQTIGQGIQGAAQQTQQNIGQAQQQFGQQSGANRLDTAQNAALVQQALSNPTQFAQTPGQVSQFQNLISGTYQGPQGLQNAQQLQAQAQNVQQLGQAVGTAGGRQGLLQQFVGTPQYTAGQQTLDSLLLGATGGPALAQARRSTTGILGQEQQAQTGAAQTAQELTNRAQQFGQNVQQQFGQNVAQQQQALTQAAQNAQQKRDQQVAALQQAAAQGNLSQDLVNQLGLQQSTLSGVGFGSGDFGTQGAHLISGPQGLYTYGIDPSKYIQESAQQATAQNTANAQQYAQMQALAKLGGQFAPVAAQQTLGQFQNPSQAGTFQAGSAYNVNAPAFQQALAGGQQAYQDYVNNVLQPALNAYNQGQMGAEAQRALAQSTTAVGGPGSTPHWDMYWNLLRPYSQALQGAESGLSQAGPAVNIVPNPGQGS